MTTCDWFDNGAGTTLEWITPEDSVYMANHRYILTWWGSSAVQASTQCSEVPLWMAWLRDFPLRGLDMAHRTCKAKRQPGPPYQARAPCIRRPVYQVGGFRDSLEPSAALVDRGHGQAAALRGCRLFCS